MGSTLEHQRLVDDTLFTFGSMPDVRVWPRPVGFDREKRIKYGIPGESDIDGIFAPYGRRLCLEVKTGSAVLSKNQKIFRKMIEKMGGIYIVVRTIDQARKDFFLKREIIMAAQV